MLAIRQGLSCKCRDGRPAVALVLLSDDDHHVFYDSQRRRSHCTVYRKAAVRLPPTTGHSSIELGGWDTGRLARASSRPPASSGKRSRPMVACQKEACEHHLNPSNRKCRGQGQLGSDEDHQQANSAHQACQQPKQTVAVDSLGTRRSGSQRRLPLPERRIRRAAGSIARRQRGRRSWQSCSPAQRPPAGSQWLPSHDRTRSDTGQC